MTQSSSPICPHLGLAGDRTVVRTTPDAGHRCYPQTPPGSPDHGHQGSYCLAAGHTGCRLYVAPAPDDAESRLSQAQGQSRGKRRNRVWLWVILAVLVLAVFLIPHSVLGSELDGTSGLATYPQ